MAVRAELARTGVTGASLLAVVVTVAHATDTYLCKYS